MVLRLFLLLFVAGLPLCAQQDDGPIKMNPELALAIPLLQKGKDVTVKFPILINRTTVIKPGMALRVLYIPPVQSESANLVLAQKGNMEESFSRPVSQTDGEAKLPPEIAHEISRQRKRVWQVPINFQLALSQLPTDSLHLIYSSTGDDRNLDDERLNFFDGLFLGSPTGGTSVLAVEVGSKAEAAGFKVGDQILAVSGATAGPDLATFPRLWLAAKARAKDENAASFPFVVRSPGEAGTHSLNLAMPPMIKSQLMQGF